MYPVAQELYNDLADANKRIARALDAQNLLQQEILRLSRMLQPGEDARYLEPHLK